LNILPKLNQFIEEITKEVSPETDTEQNGQRTLTFKNNDYTKFEALKTQAELLAEQLYLTKYISLEYRDLTKEKISFPLTYTFEIDLGKIREQDLQKNLENFIIGLQNRPDLTILRNDNWIIVACKPEVLSTRDRLNDWMSFIRSVAYINNLQKTLKEKCCGPFEFEAQVYKGLMLRINLANLHKNRLDYYKHKDMTAQDASESIKYLIGLGWSASEIGVSRPEYFRNKPKKPVSL